jgi:hypothetical protein
MARLRRKKEDGTLEVTNTVDPTITSFSRKDLICKIAEAQTQVDHMQIDLIAAQTALAERQDDLAELDRLEVNP